MLLTGLIIRLGQAPAVEFMAWMGLKLSPDRPIHDIIHGSQDGLDDVEWFLNEASLPSNAISCTGHAESKLPILLRKLDVEKIEKKLGYQFQEKTFLIQAFTHASCTNNKLTDSYERLEVTCILVSISLGCLFLLVSKWLGGLQLIIPY